MHYIDVVMSISRRDVLLKARGFDNAAGFTIGFSGAFDFAALRHFAAGPGLRGAGGNRGSGQAGFYLVQLYERG